MKKEDLPQQYWHCNVSVPGIKTPLLHYTANDLPLNRLLKEIVEPWHAGRWFTVNGRIVRSRDEPKDITIKHTQESVKSFQDRYPGEKRVVPATDYTHQFLFADLKPGLPLVDEQFVIAICERLPKSAKILAKPRRTKPAFDLKDEYDVQDFLHCLLRAYLKFSVQEDPIGKIARTKSSRADISIEELGVLIEVKFARSPSDQKAFVEQFSQDLVLYTKWSPLKSLLYVIYNSDVLADAEALLQLDGKKQIGEKIFTTKIILI